MSPQLHLLRGFELRCDGGAVKLPLGSQRVLAFLALQDRPVLRLYVAGTLWLQATEGRAAANLRSALWRLRQPGHELVVSTPTHLSLHHKVEVDLHRALERSRLALGPAAASDELVDDQDLAGELLPDWYDDWVEADRERLRQLRLHALEAIAEQLLAQARYGQAVDACLLAIRLDPLRESPRRVLIRTYVAEGNWNEALQHYRAYSRRLVRDAGLEPSVQMQDLVRSLLSEAPQR